MNKSWRSHKQVVNKLWRSCEQATGWVKKKATIMCCEFLGFLWVRITVLHIFNRPFHANYKNYLISIRRNFLDQNIWRTTMSSKRKNNILMEVLKFVTSLCGWWLSSVGIDYSFWVVNFLWVVLPLLVFGLSIPQRLVTTSRGHPLPTEGGYRIKHPQ